MKDGEPVILAAGPIHAGYGTIPHRVVLLKWPEKWQPPKFSVHCQCIPVWDAKKFYCDGAYYEGTPAGYAKALQCFGDRIKKCSKSGVHNLENLMPIPVSHDTGRSNLPRAAYTVFRESIGNQYFEYARVATKEIAAAVCKSLEAKGIGADYIGF